MNPWITEKACAKINLALHVLGKREDGYHELDSIIAFADFGDELRLREAEKTSLEISGAFANNIPSGDDNIILKAHNLLQQIVDVKIPKVEITLQKNLPVAAGLGGGSADAAALVRAFSRLINIELSAQKIQSLAKSLGADVPVCYYQTSCQIQGIGEIIRALPINLPKAIVLINPLKSCSTQEVFSQLALKNGQHHLEKVDVENSPLWRNDLTTPAIAVEPDIKNVLSALEQEQCFLATRMSGSGATCFGLIDNMASASAAAARLSVRNPNWWVKAAELL